MPLAERVVVLRSSSVARVFWTRRLLQHRLAVARPELCPETAIHVVLDDQTRFPTALPRHGTTSGMVDETRLADVGLCLHIETSPVQLTVKVLRRPCQGPTRGMVDMITFNIFGDGAWKERQHGVGRGQAQHNVHLVVEKPDRTSSTSQ